MSKKAWFSRHFVIELVPLMVMKVYRDVVVPFLIADQGDSMTQDEAVAIALSHARLHHITTDMAEITAFFRPMDTTYRFWNNPEDSWFILISYPQLEEFDSNCTMIVVNARTKEAFHEPHL